MYKRIVHISDMRSTLLHLLLSQIETSKTTPLQGSGLSSPLRTRIRNWYWIPVFIHVLRKTSVWQHVNKLPHPLAASSCCGPAAPLALVASLPSTCRAPSTAKIRKTYWISESCWRPITSEICFLMSTRPKRHHPIQYFLQSLPAAKCGWFSSHGANMLGDLLISSPNPQWKWSDGISHFNCPTEGMKGMKGTTLPTLVIAMVLWSMWGTFIVGHKLAIAIFITSLPVFLRENPWTPC